MRTMLRKACGVGVARGGAVVATCGERAGHEPPHHGGGVSWTMPGESGLPGVEAAMPASLGDPMVAEVVGDALARGVTVGQIVEAIEGLAP